MVNKRTLPPETKPFPDSSSPSFVTKVCFVLVSCPNTESSTKDLATSKDKEAKAELLEV